MPTATEKAALALYRQSRDLSLARRTKAGIITPVYDPTQYVIDELPGEKSSLPKAKAVAVIADGSNVIVIPISDVE